MKIDLSKRVEVEINQCVHYSAFRYGHNEYNPYESYLARLHKGDPMPLIKDEFENFLLHYRPKDMGSAIGIKLSKDYPMWLFPWNRLGVRSYIRRLFRCIYPAHELAGWYTNIADIPDIITHFSNEGIPRFMIEKEYEWLHRAYQSIKQEGYLPEKYGFPQGQLLVDNRDNVACLLLDGNHRTSALSALGYTSIYVDFNKKNTVYLSDLDRWPLVSTGYFNRKDAMRVFEAYFSGNHNYKISNDNVMIID